MTDRQIEPRREYPLAPRARPRNLPAQVSTSLLRPVAFFRSLALVSETRQWLWVGVMILILVGLSAVQQESLRDAGAGTGAPDFGGAPMDDGFGGPPIDGGFGGVPGDFGGPPPDFGGAPPGGGGGGGNGITANWTTAILAAAGIVLGWGVLTLLLAEVSLFRGMAPRLGQNFQIAIWASLPFGFMAAVQLVYYGAGGAVGEPGVAGVVPLIPGYDSFAPFVQALLLSLGGRLTIFWLWSLAMIYFGARFALQGRRWASMLVVVLWVIILVVVPVVTGAVAPPEPDLSELLDEVPFVPDFEGGMPGEMPGGEFDPAMGPGGVPGGVFGPEGTAEIDPRSLPDSGMDDAGGMAPQEPSMDDAGEAEAPTESSVEGESQDEAEAPIRPVVPVRVTPGS